MPDRIMVILDEWHLACSLLVVQARSKTRFPAAESGSARSEQAGFTLVEVMVAAALFALFFVSIFELNAMCLRSINSGKESLGALQSVQNRTEVLRNLAFSDLTTSSFVQNLMAAPANPAPFSEKATEVVTISKYPVANGATQFTRQPNGTLLVNSVATDLGSDLVKVDVKVSWTTTAGGRARIEQTSCLVSNGTKK